jgi:hypothetical protein
VVTLKTAINQIPIQNDFEMFPNPASDVVTVKINSIHSVIVIYNSVGAIVYSNSNPESELKIPVKQIGEAGVYFIKVNASVKKFVIVKSENM